MNLWQMTGSESFNGDKVQAFVFNILFMLNPPAYKWVDRPLLMILKSIWYMKLHFTAIIINVTQIGDGWAEAVVGAISLAHICLFFFRDVCGYVSVSLVAPV